MNTITVIEKNQIEVEVQYLGGTIFSSNDSAVMLCQTRARCYQLIDLSNGNRLSDSCIEHSVKEFKGFTLKQLCDRFDFFELKFTPNLTGITIVPEIEKMKK